MRGGVVAAVEPNVRAGGAGAALAAVRSWVVARLGGRSTPALVRTAMVATALAGVLFGVLGALGVARRDDALADARVAAEQLMAVQDLRVRLVHADALASESYLAGAEADGSLRTDYEQELAAVGALLTEVSDGAGSDVAAALGVVAQRVTVYAGLVEQAQANNRQGFPIGAAYLRQANTVVAGEAVPELEGVEQTLRRRVNAALDRAERAGVWLPLFGVLALGVLVAAGAWVAMRFRRLVNVPLAAAAALVAVLLLVGYGMQSSAVNRGGDTTTGPLTRADVTAQARAAAFAARTQETAVLINRGNNSAQRAEFAAALATAEAAAAASCPGAECEVQRSLTAYRTAAVAVVELGDVDWERARADSLGRSAEAFGAFASIAEAAAGAEIDTAAAALAEATDGLAGLRVVVFVGGLLAAALALAGLNQRLKEYR